MGERGREFEKYLWRTGKRRLKLMGELVGGKEALRGGKMLG